MNIQDNKKTWNDCSFPENGDIWSRKWGNTDWLWNITIRPRLEAIRKAKREYGFPYFGNTFEIASGMGRITRHLIRYILDQGNDDNYTLFGNDLTEKCVEHCNDQLQPHYQGYLTDGKTIEADNNTLDFIFSWDSLVHTDKEVMYAYAKEIKRTLGEGGLAFIHHSNLGSFVRIVELEHLRDKEVSAEWFLEVCRDIGLYVVSQELIGWGCNDLIDCFTVLRKPSKDGLNQMLVTKEIENPKFMEEAAIAKRLWTLYDNQ